MPPFNRFHVVLARQDVDVARIVSGSEQCEKGLQCDRSNLDAYIAQPDLAPCQGMVTCIMVLQIYIATLTVCISS